MSLWSKEGINERLRELVGKPGWSFADIAAAISKEFRVTVSRNACIGRAGRQGFDVPGAKVKFRGQRSLKKADKPEPKEKQYYGGLMSALIAKSVRVEPGPPVIIIDADIPLEQRKTIFELNSDTCRWPCGEGAAMFFCGAVPLAGCPYCAGHSARAYKSNYYSLKRAA